nr:hypothetical protein [uncultured Sphingomonas sp.]
MSVTNGDTNRIWQITTQKDQPPEAVHGVGSFHKSLPHNQFGEVEPAAFAALVAATRGDGRGFAQVPQGAPRELVPDKDAKKFGPAATFTNPQAGLARDALVHAPTLYTMPPAPRVNSNTTAAEMTELYWMAILRDADLGDWSKASHAKGWPAAATVEAACKEINAKFEAALASNAVSAAGAILNGDGDGDHFLLGVDIPGSSGGFDDFSAHTLFRLGLPGDEYGPLVSQFFLRPAPYGTQTIDQRELPYAAGRDYLVHFEDWLQAQNSGKDRHGQSYSQSNEFDSSFFGTKRRYIATMRDLARFVNKDALHQAYFNAALILLSGGAKWSLGNPYADLGNKLVQATLPSREAGFGVLGGPHLLALVSEVATRALKTVWQQKWQQHLRLRPEAYGGLVHVQTIGVCEETRDYGLPDWVAKTHAAKTVRDKNADSLLLPLAFTAGSPTHPAYGAGHATVAGACVTVLKAYFLTYMTDARGNDHPVAFSTLTERDVPYGPSKAIQPWVAYSTGTGDEDGPPKGGIHAPLESVDNRRAYTGGDAAKLTIEGELNKLAQNVAMGRSMGGVHWRTDNTRSLMLGEALAAEMLAAITTDANEKPFFTFRTFARRADGEPRKVHIQEGRVYVDGVEVAVPASRLGW